jgi:hypothetical protein
MKRYHSNRLIVLLILIGVVGLTGFSFGASGLVFPGPSIEPARVSEQPSSRELRNNVLSATFAKSGDSIRLASIHDLMSGKKQILNAPLFVVTMDGNVLSSDAMQLDGDWQVQDLLPDPEAAKFSARIAGKRLTVALLDPKTGLKAHWTAILCDESNYIRQEVTFSSDKALRIEYVELINASLEGAVVKGAVAGSPVVTDHLFMGLEHPAAENSVSKATQVRCGYARQVTLGEDNSYTCSSVIGVYPEGQLRRAFLYYLERERAHPNRQYVHYNTWYDLNIGRPQNRMTEKEALDSINQIGTELVTKRGMKMDGFVMDDGWDSHETVWDFHEGFPNGFTELGKTAAKYGAGVGVWMSPFGGYGGAKAARIRNGLAMGYETNKTGFSLSGKNYGAHYKKTCIRMITEFGVNYFKFDGMGAGMSADGNDPEVADDMNALVDIIAEMREYKKDIYINATTGTWPSPFWTRQCDSIWRQGGDTAFYGVGSLREQWITYRDMITYSRIVIRGPLYPLNSVMFHGLVIGDVHYPKKMELDETSVRHEIRAAFGCGSGLLELYITPRLLTTQMWDDIAESAKWYRSNEEVFVDTHWIGGYPNRLEVYGWASWSPQKGALTLRNPNEVAQTYQLDIGKAFELPAGAAQTYILTSPFKDQVIQKIEVTAGEPVELVLQPFDVIVFDATPKTIVESSL